MGEHSIVEIADSLESGIPVEEITYIPGTVFKCKDLDRVYEPILLPSFDEVKEDKKPMQKVLLSSMRIQIPSQPDHWQNFMEAEAILCRILRQSL